MSEQIVGKRCSECRIVKAPDKFYSNSRCSGGIDYLCKQCRKKIATKWRSKHYYEPTKEKKQCRKCLDTKEPEEFSRNKANKDGLQSYCKACNAEYRRARNK